MSASRPLERENSLWAEQLLIGNLLHGTTIQKGYSEESMHVLSIYIYKDVGIVTTQRLK